MTRSNILLTALLAGIVAGVLVRLSGSSALQALALGLAPLGQLWIRALQMTLVPLIFAVVAGSVGSAARSGQGGRLLGYSAAAFLVLLLGAITLAMTVLHGTLWLWPLPLHTLDGLPGAGPAPAVPGTVDQLLAIIPANPVAAAAAGQMFPLAIFALLFGVAMTRGGEGGHRTLVTMVDELAATMMRIVEWVLMAAPVGIFVLALGIAQSAGLGLASLLAHLVVITIAYCLLGIGLCYAMVAVTGAYPLVRFARGIAGAQAMAAGTTSSLASTPAMLDAALVRLRLPPDIAGLVIPLAVSVFRFGTTGLVAISVLLAAHAAGIVPTFAQYAMLLVAFLLAGFGGAGLPGAAVIYAATAPGLQILGAPLAVIPLYIAVNGFTDLFLTTMNVTADLTVTTLIARFAARRQGHAIPDEAPVTLA